MNSEQKKIWDAIKTEAKKITLPDGVIDIYLHDKGIAIPSVAVYPDRGQIKISGRVFAKDGGFLTQTVFSEAHPFDAEFVIDAINRAILAVSIAAQDQTPPTESEAFGVTMLEKILKTYDRIDAREQFGG